MIFQFLYRSKHFGFITVLLSEPARTQSAISLAFIACTDRSVTGQYHFDKFKTAHVSDAVDISEITHLTHDENCTNAQELF